MSTSSEDKLLLCHESLALQIPFYPYPSFRIFLSLLLESRGMEGMWKAKSELWETWNCPSHFWGSKEWVLKFTCLEGVCTDGCLCRASVWPRIQLDLMGNASHMRMVFRQIPGKQLSLRCSSNPNSGPCEIYTQLLSGLWAQQSIVKWKASALCGHLQSWPWARGNVLTPHWHLSNAELSIWSLHHTVRFVAKYGPPPGPSQQGEYLAASASPKVNTEHC